MAYGSLLQERRRALHAQIVEALETLAGDRQDEQVDRLAHHALRGEVWDKALPYYRQAGAKALAASAYREAVMCFEQALEALAHLPLDRPTLEQAVDLRCDLDAALLPLGQHEQRLTHLRAAEQVAVGLEDHHRLGYLYRRLANALRNTQAYESALAYCQQAHAMATTLGDTGLQRWANLEMGWLYVELGDYRQAIPYLQQLLTGPQEEQRDQSFRIAVHARLLMIRCLSELGGFAEGIAYGDEALPLVEASARLYERLIVYWRVGYLHMRQGTLYQALPLLERAVVLSQEADIPEVYRLAAPRLALAYALAGRAADALTVLGQVVGNTGVPLDPLTCGEVYLLAGCMEEAQRLTQQVLANPRHRKRRSQEARALWLLGEIAMHGNPPDVVQAETHYQQALDPSRGTRHAPPPGPLSPGSRHPVRHHWSAGAGPHCPGHRHRIIRCYGHGILAAAGRGSASADRVRGAERTRAASSWYAGRSVRARRAGRRGTAGAERPEKAWSC